jgi:predicted dehydrogenase
MAAARYHRRMPENTQSPLRVGVVGVGRMGRHHARVFSEMPGVALVGVCDRDGERAADIAEARGCDAFTDVADLVAAGVDAVAIAAPTVHHRSVAEPFLKRGAGCLIEKPLAPDAAEARELAELASASGAVLQVGHTERYNPAVRALQAERDRAAAEGRPGIHPRFIEVHRVSPMTFRSVDVGVVFDMMIHDLDVVLNLVGGMGPSDVQATGVPVLTEHEDVANARLTFQTPAGECIANITASRLAFKTERKIRIIAEDAYVSIDYAKKSGVLIRKTANELQLSEVRAALREGKDLSDLDYSELVTIEDLEIDDAEPLRKQAEDFVRAVRTGERPPVDAAAGLAAVSAAERITAACAASAAASS